MRVSGLKTVTAAIGLLALLSCGGSPAAPETPNADPIITVTIVGERGNASFTPNPSIAAGRRVVFRNNDAIAHRVRLNDLSVDWGTIAPGGTSSPQRMPAAGTNYHCSVHPAMIGAVAIDEVTPPPTCREYC